MTENKKPNYAPIDDFPSNRKGITPHAKAVPLYDRFMAKITKTGSCWLWTAHRSSKSGYGIIRVGNHNIHAHRVSYFLFYEIDPKDLCVLHTCDNRGCVNPEHLYLGTRQDNADDMVRRGRTTGFPGERNPRCKITREQAEAIRELYGTGQYTYVQLAEKFGTNKKTVHRIMKGILYGT